MGGLNVAERLEQLAVATQAGHGVLPVDVLDQARAVQDRAGHRFRLSPEHTVVALAGATGSGKSSLLNALAGEEVAAVDVLRPTTSEALAVVRGEDEAAADLLDWLGVRRRHGGRDGAGAGPGTGGLVLLDLPDHDSVVVEHRLEAERLVALVDLMVWVVDPQKYADAVLHDRYLRPLAGHRDVLLVVLNHADRLGEAEREACLRDLRRLLADDGLGGVRVLATSAVTGEGVADLRGALDDAARRREAATARVVADVAAAAGRVADACGPVVDRSATTRAHEELLAALGEAAGVPRVVDAVAASWRTRGSRATGWPPTRWLARLRPDALRRLHLGGAAAPGRGGTRAPGGPDDVLRTSLPRPGAAEQARARSAVRGFADTSAAGAPDAWVLAARAAADDTGLADDLDRAVAGTPLLPARTPVWWRAVGGLQWVLLAALLTGGGWLLALAVLAWLQLPVPPVPQWGQVPWPTVLLAGGALAGVLLAVVSRLVLAGGARRHARRATVRLRAAVQDVARRRVVDPVGEVLGTMARCRAAAEAAASGRRGRAGAGGRR